MTVTTSTMVAAQASQWTPEQLAEIAIATAARKLAAEKQAVLDQANEEHLRQRMAEKARAAKHTSAKNKDYEALSRPGGYRRTRHSWEDTLG